MGMTDRKTIMSWLESLAEPDWRLYHSDSEVQTIAKETLELLKAQEAVKVRYTAIGGLRYGACPKCDARIDNLVNPKACGFCGQELKWDA